MQNLCPTLGSGLRILSFFETSVRAGTERRCLPVMETTWQHNDNCVNDGCSRTERQRPRSIAQGLIEGPGAGLLMIQFCLHAQSAPSSLEAGERVGFWYTLEQTLTGAAWCCSNPRTWWALWCCSARGTCSNTFGNGIHSEETSDIYHRRLASGMFSEPGRGKTWFALILVAF